MRALNVLLPLLAGAAIALPGVSAPLPGARPVPASPVLRVPAELRPAAAEVATLEDPAVVKARASYAKQERVRFAYFPGGCARQRTVALTFDDGPDPTNTPKILDVLKREGAPATFFVVGFKAADHPELIRRAAAEGHELGNHTYDHLELTGLTARQVRAEVEQTNKVLEKIVGVPTRWFRAPGCHYTTQALDVVNNLGMVRVDSTDNPGDFDGKSAGRIVRRVLGDLGSGDVILLHDRMSETVEALPKLIHAIRDRGYKIVPLSELALRAQSTPGWRPAFCERREGVQIDRPRLAKLPVLRGGRRTPVERGTL